MILLLDNYDSFTWNLVQRIGELDPTLDIQVIRNDKITADEAETLHPTHIIISPGPCTPNEAGVSSDLITRFAGRVPILGVCLGHQCIGQCAGMTVKRHDHIMHGKTSEIHHDGKGIFQGVPNPFTATRYHSLIVARDTVTNDYEISAWTDDDEIMALRRIPQNPNDAPVEGVQFHPESFLTLAGPIILANFLGLPIPHASHV
ncbi:MAG: aminodeoxychorismate/anthranilate synthase component II [Phycisphaerales bacterium]|nr:aminodeoxychorismate/anthranilate synthase component II [Phycisphaerales bacterium]